MNVYDTHKIVALLNSCGYLETDYANEANIVILYTCHIREKAIQKVLSDLGKIARYKEKSGAIILVGGCMAQQLGEQIFRKAPMIDIAFGPQNIQEIPNLIEEYVSTGKRTLSNKFQVNGKFSMLNKMDLQPNVSTFLTIQEGCSNFCTYCVVPYTRGPEHSRSVSDILIEAQKLVDRGAKEITLLGQNVNAYTSTEDGRHIRLEDLICRLASINGISRIRYMSPNPQNMTPALMDAHRDIDKLMPSTHIPAQSGSNRILRKMNRPYTVQEYLEIIDQIRSKRPDIAISSDFIVGFPSETEAEFMETMDLIKRVRYSTAFYFKYSRRPGTPADTMPDQISEDDKSHRFAILDSELKSQQLAYNKSFIGKTVSVLLETRLDDKTIFGKTEHNVSCIIDDCEAKPGDTVQVDIKNAKLKSISGETQNRGSEGGS